MRVGRGGGRRKSLGFFFFFQAEDGIRDYKVTGVQTCALPISSWLFSAHEPRGPADLTTRSTGPPLLEANPNPAFASDDVRCSGDSRCGRTHCWIEIGRASCRERV